MRWAMAARSSTTALLFLLGQGNASRKSDHHCTREKGQQRFFHALILLIVTAL
jgi:hypothetical protein